MCTSLVSPLQGLSLPLQEPVAPQRTMLSPCGLTQGHHTHICLIAVFPFKLLTLNNNYRHHGVFCPAPQHHATLLWRQGLICWHFPMTVSSPGTQRITALPSPHTTSTALSEALPSSSSEALINPVSRRSYSHSLLPKNPNRVGRHGLWKCTGSYSPAGKYPCSPLTA